MVQDDINLIIQSAIKSKKHNNVKNEKELITNFQKAIIDNYFLFESTNKIDLANNNGFELSKNVIERLLNKYLNISPLINESQDVVITKDNLLVSNLYSNLGIIHVIFDGNTYTMLELILLGLITHNTIIFSYNGYMHGTNGLLITLIQTVLEKENYQKEMFQHSFSINAEEYFSNFKTINKTIIIGDGDFQTKYNKLCANDILISGYNHYDIYIDDLEHIETIKKIVNAKHNVDLYINSNLNIDIDNAFLVNDAEEAIAQINFNGSGFSSSIFTTNSDNASKFIKNVNSKRVLVNASPTLEGQLDIKQTDLLKEKKVIIPNIYKFDGTKINFSIN